MNKPCSSDNVAFNVGTPVVLQKKVWFEIMSYLCRRGRENLRSMSKSTFVVEKVSSGLEHVHQVIDEADKKSWVCFILTFFIENNENRRKE